MPTSCVIRCYVKNVTLLSTTIYNACVGTAYLKPRLSNHFYFAILDAIALQTNYLLPGLNNAKQIHCYINTASFIIHYRSDKLFVATWLLGLLSFNWYQ